MKGRLRFLLLVCLPAVMLTVGGVAALALIRRSTAEVLWNLYRREADRLARSVAPGHFPDEARGAFLWRADRGLVAAQRLTPAVRAALAATNVVWTAEGRKVKTPKIGWMNVGGVPVAWRSLRDGSVVGAEMEPFADSAGQELPLFAVGSVMVVLLGGAVCLGAWGLHRAAAAARRDNAEKTSFLSNCTHELKTPLASIRLWGEMLQADRVRPERKAHAVDVIVRENARMIRLVENLLDFSRLDQNRRVYREEETDVRDLAGETLELVRDGFAPPGPSLVPGEHVLARLDVDAVRQILVNLLSNAAKYAPGKPVELAVVQDGGRVRVTVADHGPGLSDDAKAHVFERFWRADTALAKKTGGLGLGLAISQGLARGMGGSLEVGDSPGGGCVFTLTLPLRRLDFQQAT